ncbi:MAG: helix-turn-helix domain-containing protein [Smithellaceae bacterium]|nr:helix-turn-helix domain-containing protein [Smithellaceae bacterium]
MEKGNFRDDLYFRLNVIRLNIPPLRDRKADILPLFRFFVIRFNRQFNKRFVKISPEAEEQLLACPWPGNIREIRNTAERIVLLETGDTVLGRHTACLIREPREGEKEVFLRPRLLAQGLNLEEIEKGYIEEALRIKQGNKVQAARLLGITRSALLYRLEKHGIK